MSNTPNEDNEIWRFETARYVVTCHALVEDMDPADSFEFPDDVAFARTADGYGPQWFCACVRVVDKATGLQLGTDYLGGCSYHSWSDFMKRQKGAYIGDMVRCAITDARSTLGKTLLQGRMIMVTQEDLRRFVQNNVHYCVSSLVSTLAQGYGFVEGRSDLRELCEQAYELSSPLLDYEEAAIQAGWEAYTDEFGVPCWKEGDATFAGTAEQLCQAHDIEPYEREIYEHWIVDKWFAERLAEKGERVDTDFAGMVVWGRTTTGQAILLDRIVVEIYAELHA